MRHDPIDKWIEKIGTGKSFIDIGGIGENSGNERVSTALQSQASDVAIADLEPYSSLLWKKFFALMDTRKISGFKTFELIDIRSEKIMALLPSFDVVHATGILYHLPDPISGLYNLARRATEYLIVNTVVIPDRVENENGALITEPSRAVFLPAMTEHDRLVLGRHYRSKFGWDINIQSPRLGDVNPIMPFVTEHGLSCYPYWWLFTKHAFRQAVQMMGFNIEDEWVWEDHTLAVLAKRR